VIAGAKPVFDIAEIFLDLRNLEKSASKNLPDLKKTLRNKSGYL
jgi:hypothetical protein